MRLRFTSHIDEIPDVFQIHWCGVTPDQIRSPHDSGVIGSDREEGLVMGSGWPCRPLADELLLSPNPEQRLSPVFVTLVIAAHHQKSIYLRDPAPTFVLFVC